MMPPENLLAFFQSIGWPEMLVVGIIALLIFGRRLPEVGRSLGKGIVEFKKGLKDTSDEVKQSLPTEPDGSFSQPDRSSKKNDSETDSHAG